MHRCRASSSPWRCSISSSTSRSTCSMAWSIRACGSMPDMLPLLRHARYVLSENPVTGLAFGLFTLFLLAAILGPAIAPYDPLQSNAAMALKPPSAEHWFGTDQLGRDIFSRVLVATRLDLSIAFASVILAFLLGALSGVAAGYFGGWT